MGGGGVGLRGNLIPIRRLLSNVSNEIKNLTRKPTTSSLKYCISQGIYIYTDQPAAHQGEAWLIRLCRLFYLQTLC